MLDWPILGWPTLGPYTLYIARMALGIINHAARSFKKKDRHGDSKFKIALENAHPGGKEYLTFLVKEKEVLKGVSMP